MAFEAISGGGGTDISYLGRAWDGQERDKRPLGFHLCNPYQTSSSHAYIEFSEACG